MPRLTRLVLCLAGLAAGLVILVFFIASNFVIVEVRLFGIHRPVRLAWVILVSLLAGGVIGASLIAAWWWLRRR